MKVLYLYVIISETGQTEHRLSTSGQTEYRLATSCQISGMKFLELFGVFGHRNDYFTYFQHQILLLLNLDLVHLMSMAMDFKLNSILTYNNQSIQYYSLVCLCIWKIRPCTQSGLILLANQTMHSKWYYPFGESNHALKVVLAANSEFSQSHSHWTDHLASYFSSPL